MQKSNKEILDNKKLTCKCYRKEQARTCGHVLVFVVFLGLFMDSFYVLVDCSENWFEMDWQQFSHLTLGVLHLLFLYFFCFLPSKTRAGELTSARLDFLMLQQGYFFLIWLVSAPFPLHYLTPPHIHILTALLCSSLFWILSKSHTCTIHWHSWLL